MNPWTPLVVATIGWGSAVVFTRALLTSGVPTLVVVPIRFTVALVLLVAALMDVAMSAVILRRRS